MRQGMRALMATRPHPGVDIGSAALVAEEIEDGKEVIVELWTKVIVSEDESQWTTPMLEVAYETLAGSTLERLALRVRTGLLASCGSGGKALPESERARRKKGKFWWHLHLHPCHLVILRRGG